MSRDRNRVTRIISVVVFILMEMAALYMLRRSGDLQNIWLNKVSHRFMTSVWGTSDNIRYYFSLKGQNELLAEENERLASQVRAYREKELSDKEQAATDSLGTSSDFQYLPATVVKISRNKQHNYIILNKGSEDGVKPQSGIVTTKGIIGIIDAVDKHYSYGLSFMNTGINISARIGASGAVGPLSWDGRSSDRAILKEIPLQYKFQPGDTVWTSGFSAIFPSDIPLGVTGESHVVNGAVNEIEVFLFQNFSALRYVTIVENIGGEEIENLEKAER